MSASNSQTDPLEVATHDRSAAVHSSDEHCAHTYQELTFIKGIAV